nr:50S ribosomal protein L17 [Desulfobacterales bacterium]
MRHRKAGKKLNRTSSHRKAMFRNMVTSLLKYGSIKTTDAKAKEIRRWSDRIITLAKRGDLHARRQALAIVRDKTVVRKLFEEANELYGDVPGGYTRVVKIDRRKGDAAPVSRVELISTREKSKESKGLFRNKGEKIFSKKEGKEPEVPEKEERVGIDQPGSVEEESKA